MADNQRVGITLSPWSRVSLTTHYRNRHKENRYDHLRDETSFTDFDGTKIAIPPKTRAAIPRTVGAGRARPLRHGGHRRRPNHYELTGIAHFRLHTRP